MRRAHLVLLLTLLTVVPAVVALLAAPAGRASGNMTAAGAPCFVAGNAGYKITASAQAARVVRVDNAAPNPNLRLQRVEDAAAADFVLVDDTDQANACKNVTTSVSIRIDETEARPDLTVAISRDPADHKIYLHSARFTERDAAALFAVIWQNSHRTGSLGTTAR